jgi:hypothetical protein
VILRVISPFERHKNDTKELVVLLTHCKETTSHALGCEIHASAHERLTWVCGLQIEA